MKAVIKLNTGLDYFIMLPAWTPENCLIGILGPQGDRINIEFIKVRKNIAFFKQI